MSAFTASLSIPSNTKESPNFSAYIKNKRFKHIIKGMLFLKCHSHLQLYFIKDKEILIVILSFLSRKLFWNRREGILSLGVVTLQQPLDRWQLTELLQVFLLLLIKNTVPIVPTALKNATVNLTFKGLFHLSYSSFGNYKLRHKPCHLLLLHHH